MFFFLTKKLIKKFSREAHHYLKARFSPWRMSVREVLWSRRNGFERHHYRLGQRRVIMV